MYSNIENYERLKRKIGCPNSNDITFVKNFSSQGKQGIAGLVSIGEHTVAYKMSQYINHIILHESAVMDDLTSSLERQKQLEKIKSDFLSVTSHELRTPLTPIKAELQILINEFIGKD